SGLGANNDLIAEAGMNRAVAELRASDSNGARAELDRVLQSRDADSTALGMAYFLRAQSMFQAGGDMGAALADLDESAKLQPDYLGTRLLKAEIYCRQSQPDAARQELDNLLKAAPDAASAHRLMGLVWLMLGKPQDAQGSLDRAEKLYSEWVAELRREEAQAQGLGDAFGARVASEGIL